MGPTQLGAAIASLVGSIISDRTRQIYKRAWQSLSQFTSSINVTLSLPLSNDVLLSYIAFLNASGYAAATINTYMSAFSFVHKINNLHSPADSFVINRILKKLLANKQPDTRMPITPDVLIRICSSLSYVCDSTYECALFRCMFVIAFTAMLRISEITTGNRSSHNIMFQHITLEAYSTSLTLVSYKHSVKPVTLVLREAKNSPLCPVRVMKGYLLMRGGKNGFLFIHANGSAVSRTVFHRRLMESLLYNGVNTAHISSHSFRIGGATYLARCGYSDDAIKKLGRWKSNALETYIRLPSLQVGAKPT